MTLDRTVPDLDPSVNRGLTAPKSLSELIKAVIIGRNSRLRRSTIAIGVCAAFTIMAVAQQPEPEWRRLLKATESELTAWINSHLRAGMPVNDGFLMVMLNRSSVALPLIEAKIEEVLRSPTPLDSFDDKSVDPQRFVDAGPCGCVSSFSRNVFLHGDGNERFTLTHRSRLDNTAWSLHSTPDGKAYAKLDAWCSGASTSSPDIGNSLGVQLVNARIRTPSGREYGPLSSTAAYGNGNHITPLLRLPLGADTFNVEFGLYTVTATVNLLVSGQTAQRYCTARSSPIAFAGTLNRPTVSGLSQSTVGAGESLHNIVISGTGFRWSDTTSGVTVVTHAWLVHDDGAPVEGTTVILVGMNGQQALVDITTGLNTLPGEYLLGLTVLGQRISTRFSVTSAPKITGRITWKDSALSGVEVTVRGVTAFRSPLEKLIQMGDIRFQCPATLAIPWNRPSWTFGSRQTQRVL